MALRKKVVVMAVAAVAIAASSVGYWLLTTLEVPEATLPRPGMRAVFTVERAFSTVRYNGSSQFSEWWEVETLRTLGEMGNVTVLSVREHRRDYDSYSYYSVDNLSLVATSGGNLWRVLRYLVRFDPPLLILAFPLSEGLTWTQDGIMASSSQTTPYRLEGFVLDRKVDDYAGLRAEAFTVLLSIAIGDSLITQRIEYAPSLGMFARVETQWEYPDGIRVWENRTLTDLRVDVPHVAGNPGQAIENRGVTLYLRNSSHDTVRCIYTFDITLKVTATEGLFLSTHYFTLRTQGETVADVQHGRPPPPSAGLDIYVPSGEAVRLPVTLLTCGTPDGLMLVYSDLDRTIAIDLSGPTGVDPPPVSDFQPPDGLKQWVSRDGRGIRVDGYQLADTVEFTSAPEGFRFLVVNMSLRNSGDEAWAVSPSGFVLRDGLGQLWSTSAYLGVLDDRLVPQEIPPGGQVQAVLLFEVPDDPSVPSRLDLWFQRGPVTIFLGIA